MRHRRCWPCKPGSCAGRHVADALGREVARLADGPMGAGYQHVRFDASGLPSGVYLYRLEAGTFQQTNRMVLLK